MEAASCLEDKIGEKMTNAECTQARSATIIPASMMLPYSGLRLYRSQRLSPAPTKSETIAPLTDSPGHLLQALGQENHPGRQPQYGECPKDEKRDRIVSRRNSLAQISKELLVNKVKPEEALDGSRAGHLGWIANRRKNVPGRSNRQKHQRARKQA